MNKRSSSFFLLKNPIRRKRKIRALGSGLSSITHQSLQPVRSACWIDDALNRTNLNVSQFTEQYIQKTKVHISKSVYEWVHQKHSAKENSVKRLELKLPNSRLIYDLDLWDLISDERKNKKTILSILYRHYNEKTRYWAFPNDLGNVLKLKQKNSDYYIPAWWHPRKMKDQKNIVLNPVKGFLNYEGLLNRGDIYGFIALLGLVRYAQATKSYSL